MKISKQDIKRMIKEELEKVLMEDYSILRDMTPGDAVAYMERELNGKTWVFWDLESIGFSGQITQYGAIAYKINDLAGDIPQQPLSTFDVNVSLNKETLSKHEAEQRVLRNQQQLDDEFEERWAMGETTSEDYELLVTIRKMHAKERPYTVQDMINYTHYEPTEKDHDQRTALVLFLDWIRSLGDNVLSVGHNIKTFDRRKIILEGEEFGVDTKEFQQLDIFDTVNFQRQLFKKLAQHQMEQGDQKMMRFFDEKEKTIKGEVKKVMAFNGKLQRMMDVYGPGEGYVQLHTAIDDTRQLITAFFKMYREVREMVQDPSIGQMTTGIQTKRAQKELERKDITDPAEISQVLSDFRRD
jgi:hypothetical protein